MQLYEQYRPTTWADVVGQEKAVAKLDRLRKRGFGGRALFITGASGTGKTTIARLIAAELADEWSTDEVDAESMTPARLSEIERESACHTIGKGGRAYIVNEAHGLRAAAVRQLLVILERVPAHVVWIFTTTTDGAAKLANDELLTLAVQTSEVQQRLEKHYRRAIKARQNVLDDILNRHESERCGTNGTRGSAWSALNAVTEHADHYRGGRQVGTWDERNSRLFESILNGERDELKQVALTQALALAN